MGKQRQFLFEVKANNRKQCSYPESKHPFYHVHFCLVDVGFQFTFYIGKIFFGGEYLGFIFQIVFDFEFYEVSPVAEVVQFNL